MFGNPAHRPHEDHNHCTVQETSANALSKNEEGLLKPGLHLAPHSQNKGLSGFQHDRCPFVLIAAVVSEWLHGLALGLPSPPCCIRS